MAARRNSRSAALVLGPQPPRKQPSQARAQALVDAILEAAARIFERDGMAATTNAIAERAGVSVGSLYQYFPNKAALLTALHERHVEEVAAAALAALEGSDGRGLDAVLAAVVRASLAVHRAAPGLQRLLHEQQPQLARPAPESPAKAAFTAAVIGWLAEALALERDATVRSAGTLMVMSESLVHAAVLASAAESDDEAAAAEIVRALGGYLARVGAAQA